MRPQIYEELPVLLVLSVLSILLLYVEHQEARRRRSLS
jgi:hypothetical protein